MRHPANPLAARRRSACPSRWLASGLALAFGLAACGNGADTAVASIPQAPVERCVSVVGAMEAGPVPGSWTQAVTQRDLQLVASAGFDTVRLPVPLADFAADEAPFTLDAEAVERLDTVTEWALAANLTVIIALDGFDALDTDSSGQSGRLNRIWLQLAEHYKGRAGNLVFELLDTDSDALTGETLDQLNRVVLEQLRDVDARRWVILPSGDGNSLSALEAANPPADRRTILAFSYFEPEAFTQPAAELAQEAEWGNMADFRAVLDAFETADGVRQRTRQPVMVGAFGVDGTVTDVMRARWIRAVRRTAETNGMGWCHVALGGEDGIFDLSTGRWTPELVDALFRDGDRLN